MKQRTINKIKRILSGVIFTVLAAVIPSSILLADNENLLYTYRDVQTLAGGVTYEKSTRLYKSGWLDVYVLTMDMNNPNVSFEVIESKNSFGAKETVNRMAASNNVVAAVNRDFFGSGNPKSSMGQVFRGGQAEQAQNYYNASEKKYAGIFLDNENKAFIDYVVSTMGFYNSNDPVIELQAKNKVTDFSKPVYFDRNAISTTASLDSNFRGLYKIVVSDGKISDITGAGETVTIPEDGYIIVMNSSTAQKKLSYYSVGQPVSFTESETFVFRPDKKASEIKVGISGGGEILRNGQDVSNGLIIGESVRNPRTCIGVNKEKDKIIIVAVDGRGKSIGATHYEMSLLLKEYGCYDAIHLDGGGSTTVAVRPEGESGIEVVNTPSEGSLRAVANGIGVRNTAEPGSLAQLNVRVADRYENYIFNNIGTRFYVDGYDENHNPVAVDTSKIEFEIEGVPGEWRENRFTPSSEGKATVTAKVGNVTGKLDIDVISGAYTIVANANTKALQVGQSTQLSAYFINKDGYESSLDLEDVEWSVDNEEVGHVENGWFVATGDGTATVTASNNGAYASVMIGVGKVRQTLEMFEVPKDLYMMYFPDDTGVTGGAGITGAYINTGSNSLMLSYHFNGNETTTQAAYACFERAPIVLPENATDLVMALKCDGSGNMVKAVLKDDNDREFLVMLEEEMTESNWKYVTAEIPQEAVAPVRVDKIYVAALSTTEAQHSAVYIDDIGAMVPKTPVNTISGEFTDYQRRDLSGNGGANEQDICVFGQTKYLPDGTKESVMTDIIGAMKRNARALLFVGDNNITSDSTDTVTLSWRNKYETNSTENVSFVSLASNNGSLRTSSPDQIRWLQGFLESYSKNNVVVYLDKDIWNNQYSLDDSRENKLLHDILKDCKKNTGKNIIVVSATGYRNKAVVKDGVRYVNLCGMSTTDTENMNSYAYLRIRADENNMYYDIINIY